MRLYLDDNITDQRVVAQLQRVGHMVVLPAEGATPGRQMRNTSPQPSTVLQPS